MKRFALLICAALVFTACEEKPTLVGDWLLTDEVHGTYHVPLQEKWMLSFHEDKTGVMHVEDSVRVRTEEFGWNLVNDTLIMFAKPTGQDEPGMPGVYKVEKLTQEEMVMEHLIVGRIWYYFDRQ